MYKEIIKNLREDRDLYQKDVAQAISVSRAVYSDYETGRVTPSIDVLIKLADFYNVSLDYLVGRKFPKK